MPPPIQPLLAFARATPVRLASFFACANAIGGVHMPFFPAWLEASGLTPSDIGLTMALMGFVRVFFGPFFSFLADAMGRRRHVVIFLVTVAVISYWGYALTSGFWAILFFSLLGGFAWSAITPIVEGVTLQAARTERFDYGRVRLWGSLAFIAANLGSGWLVAAYDLDIFLPLIIATGSMTLLAAIRLPRDAAPRQQLSKDHASSTIQEARRLCLHPVFILFVAAAAAAQGTHSYYYSFATIDWKTQGFGSSLIGLLWALGVIAEVVLFFWAAPLVRRINPVWLLVAGTASGILRWTVAAFQPALWLLLPLQLLHAGTFGAAHLGAMHFLLRATPERLVSTAQAVYAAITIGIVMAAAQYGSGLLYEEAGSRGYLAMAALSAVALVLSLLLLRLWHGHGLLEPRRPLPQGQPL